MPKKTLNYDNFLVRGDSMLPTIKPNQKIKILKIKDVKVGDIVVFNTNTDFKRKKNKKFRIIHRVVRINGNKIVTKGDNKPNFDVMDITYKELIGKVIKVGNKRVDKPYHEFINPWLARISYLQAKIDIRRSERLRDSFNFLINIKNKITGNRSLHIAWIIKSFPYLPFKISKKVLESIGKVFNIFKK